MNPKTSYHFGRCDSLNWWCTTTFVILFPISPLKIEKVLGAGKSIVKYSHHRIEHLRRNICIDIWVFRKSETLTFAKNFLNKVLNWLLLLQTRLWGLIWKWTTGWWNTRTSNCWISKWYITHKYSDVLSYEFSFVSKVEPIASKESIWLTFWRWAPFLFKSHLSKQIRNLR